MTTSELDTDLAMMRIALGMSRRALGVTGENPPVGCVIAREKRVLGRGWTQPGGRPHAETQALAQTGAAARGATAYVTLEPCAHQGRTPPCARALIDAGIARAVIAIKDPDPRVCGRGIAMLRDAGVKVDCGVLVDEAIEIACGFLSRIERGRPFLTLKMAATLDGRIATEAGESRWITGPEARARVHMLRARNDALLIGAATVAADDPALDVRLGDLGARAPRVVIASGRAPLSPGLKLMRGARAPWRIGAPRSGAEIEAPTTPEGLDLRAAMEGLGARGVNRVLCEGGGRLAAALLKAGLVDELHWFCAGAAIGSEGAPAIGPMALAALPQAPRMDLRRIERVGPDLLSVWRPALAADLPRPV